MRGGTSYAVAPVANTRAQANANDQAASQAQAALLNQQHHELEVRARRGGTSRRQRAVSVPSQIRNTTAHS